MAKKKLGNISNKVPDSTKSKPEETGTLPFTRKNYQLLIIGLVLISLGFLLMVGGGSDDPEVFDYAIFNFRRLTLAPILVLAGYVVEIIAIMKKF